MNGTPAHVVLELKEKSPLALLSCHDGDVVDFIRVLLLHRWCSATARGWSVTSISWHSERKRLETLGQLLGVSSDTVYLALSTVDAGCWGIEKCAVELILFFTLYRWSMSLSSEREK